MPRKVWDTEQDWLEAYEIRIRDHTDPLDGQKIGYGRKWAGRIEGPLDDELTRFNNRVSRLATASDALFPIGPTDRILVCGCGFGYLIDAFHDAEFPNTWGIENSPWIESNRPSESRGATRFVQNDFRGGAQARAKLRVLTGADIYNWVITEGMMESYDDAEIPELLDSAEALLDPAERPENIVHLVYAVIDPARPDRSLSPVFNQKTIAEWKAMRSSHSWVNLLNWEVG